MPRKGEGAAERAGTAGRRTSTRVVWQIRLKNHWEIKPSMANRAYPKACPEDCPRKLGLPATANLVSEAFGPTTSQKETYSLTSEGMH